MDPSTHPIQNDKAKEEQEEQAYLYAMQLSIITIVPMVLRTAIELNILEIISKSKNKSLSSIEIATQLPSLKNQEHAPLIIERMLCLLASYNILTCVEQDGCGGQQRVFGLGDVCKFLIADQDGVSLAPFLVSCQSKTAIDPWYHLKDAVLEGGSPFFMAHGVPVFEYAAIDNNIFNTVMYNHTMVTMKRILDKYEGFENLKELVDVGGGYGANLSLIVAKYPRIKGINFDLPHVIEKAPTYPGVEHVGGDMFESVPKAEALFMKWILHDWSDVECLKLLKNCYEALPEAGKLIVVDYTLPESLENDIVSRNAFKFDMNMFMCNPGGKERRKREFEDLSSRAGFRSMKIVSCVCGFSVFEFYKGPI